MNEPVSKTNGDDKHEALKNSQNKDEKVKEDCENELTSTLDPKTAESLGAETEQSPNNTEAAANDEQDINETNTNPQELMSEQTNSEEKVENEPLLPPTSPYEDFYKLWRHFNIDLGVKVRFIVFFFCVCVVCFAVVVIVTTLFCILKLNLKSFND